MLGLICMCVVSTVTVGFPRTICRRQSTTRCVSATPPNDWLKDDAAEDSEEPETTEVTEPVEELQAAE
jgi:hypothetical protein